MSRPNKSISCVLAVAYGLMHDRDAFAKLSSRANQDEESRAKVNIEDETLEQFRARQEELKRRSHRHHRKP